MDQGESGGQNRDQGLPDALAYSNILDRDELMDELFGPDSVKIDDRHQDELTEEAEVANVEGGEEHDNYTGGVPFSVTKDTIQTDNEGNLPQPDIPLCFSPQRISSKETEPSSDFSSNESLDLQTTLSNITHLKSQILSSHTLLLRLSYLRSQYFALRAQFVADKTINAQNTNTISSLREQLSSYDHDNPLLQFQLAQLKSEYQHERSIRTNLEEQLTLASKKSSLTDQAIKKLEEECSKKVERANKRYLELEKEVDRYKTKVVELLAENKKLVEECRAAQENTHSSDDIQKLKEESERLKEEIERLKADKAASIRSRARSSQLVTGRMRAESDSGVDKEVCIVERI